MRPPIGTGTRGETRPRAPQHLSLGRPIGVCEWSLEWGACDKTQGSLRLMCTGSSLTVLGVLTIQDVGLCSMRRG